MVKKDNNIKRNFEKKKNHYSKFYKLFNFLCIILLLMLFIGNDK